MPSSTYRYEYDRYPLCHENAPPHYQQQQHGVRSTGSAESGSNATSSTDEHAISLASSRSHTTNTATGNSSATASLPPPPAPPSYASSAVSDTLSSTEVVKKIFRAASAARLRRQRQQGASFGEDRSVAGTGGNGSGVGGGEQTAADFARTASMAGYLHKLGSAVPTYKRRFFVLRPSTLLYYFVGPEDSEPRGCIDLDDVAVSELQMLADGRCRFEIIPLEEGGVTGDKNIVLEAPSESMGRQWIESLGTERLSHAKSVIEDSRRTEAILNAKIDDLSRELQHMKVAEKERDAAWEDARRWKRRHESLDGGVRLLTRVICRQPEPDEGSGSTSGHDDELLSKVQRHDEQRLLDLAIPDTGFASLRNATEQLRSSLAQTSREATLVVQDADERVSDFEESLEQMEAKMQRFLEENTSLREENKRRKRDNKILVKEVKNLRLQVASRKSQEEAEAAITETENKQSRKKMNSDETSRLLNELEEHVATTLQLQQRIVDMNDGLETPDYDEVEAIVSKDEESSAIVEEEEEELPSPLAPTKLSLDDNATTKVSLIDIDSSETDEGDEEDDGDDRDTVESRRWVESPEATAIVTETGHATSSLACPRAHVQSNSLERGGDMYHLTFYSLKIGLQFQKVSASSAPKGTLTSAMAAVDDGHDGSLESELGKIAAIARQTRAETDTSTFASAGNERAKVAMPVDAVLVCGFNGFDDAVNTMRPDLGARLVAFNGMSVEIGEWTFDRIRKGIQACERPITLSFRNDNLSMQQREILTRAVTELQRSVPPRPTVRPTCTQSSPNRHQKAPPLVVDGDVSVQTFRSTLISEPPSPGGSSIASQLSFATSFHKHHHQGNATNSSSSNHSRENGDRSNINEAAVSSYQSFSDMRGGSSERSSSLAPIMSGLMSGLTNVTSIRDDKKGDDAAHYAPRYMTGDSRSLNSHRCHHEFEANLL